MTETLRIERMLDILLKSGLSKWPELKVIAQERLGDDYREGDFRAAFWLMIDGKALPL